VEGGDHFFADVGCLYGYENCSVNFYVKYRIGSDGEIFTVIVNGAGPSSKMVGFKGKMPDQDVWHIVNYLRSLGPNPAGR